MEPPVKTWRPKQYLPVPSQPPKHDKSNKKSAPSKSSAPVKPATKKPAAAPAPVAVAPPPTFAPAPKHAQAYLFTPAMNARPLGLYELYIIQQAQAAAVPPAASVKSKPAAPKKKPAPPSPPRPASPASTQLSSASTQISAASKTLSAASTVVSPPKNVKKIKVQVTSKPTRQTNASQPPPNPDAPPNIRAGCNYMFPPEHTQLHIFRKSSRVWLQRHWHKDQYVLHIPARDFKIHTAPTNLTVRDVIDKTLALSPPRDISLWAVTEAVEVGDGMWAKGSTIPYTHPRATGTLKQMGWGKKRGAELPPVWLVVHRP